MSSTRAVLFVKIGSRPPSETSYGLPPAVRSSNEFKIVAIDSAAGTVQLSPEHGGVVIGVVENGTCWANPFKPQRESQLENANVQRNICFLFVTIPSIVCTCCTDTGDVISVFFFFRFFTGLFGLPIAITVFLTSCPSFVPWRSRWIKTTRVHISAQGHIPH